MLRELALIALLPLLLPAPAVARTTLDVATPISAITVIDPARDKREAKLKRKFCRRAKAAHGKLERLLPLRAEEQGREEELGGLLLRGEMGCPKDADLAIAMVSFGQSIADILQGYPRYLASEAFFRSKRGRPEDLARAEDIARIMWLRDGPVYPGLPPHWTARERADWLGRDEVWAALGDSTRTDLRQRGLRRELLLDRQSPRFDPVRALAELEQSNQSEDQLYAAQLLLTGEVVPADPARGEALLWRAAKYHGPALKVLLDRIGPRLGGSDGAERGALTARLRSDIYNRDDPALRQRLADLLLPGLTAPQFKTQADTAWLLGDLVRNGQASAQAPLLAWIERALKSRQDLSNGETRSMLGWLVGSGSVEARAVLDRDVARTGGLVDGGLLTPNPAKPYPLEKLFTPDDYPLRALREEVEAVVQGWAVISPDGRAVDVQVTSQPEGGTITAIVATTRGIIQRRLRRPYAEWPGRYVKVQLPPIQYRLPECGTGKPPTAAVPGAIVIEGTCRRPPVYSVTFVD
ncbi:hypothetical protein [Novosphingobium sp. B 225]|uniref:hypothetical protein n=1 Tax=Novosphingobium sp. B 225 TaxID=1961849 RepID=UPI000B4A710D|nr:hypothetical protein [Novosphingobium sp. B 225]